MILIPEIFYNKIQSTKLHKTTPNPFQHNTQEHQRF